LTQEELAERTGVSVRGIGKIEAGHVGTPRPTTVRLFADAFGLTGADRDRFCATAAAETSAEKPVASMARPVPAQLPVDVRGFAGRRGELDQLDTIGTAAGESAVVVIAALSGTAGVGKTALAVHWAHRVRGRYPDGQLYVNLRGFDPTDTVVSPTDAVRGFLDALGVPAQRIPAGLDARAALYRSLLAGRRVLIVLDNARTAEQIRPLLPGSPDCLVLVTSRNQLTSLVATVGAHFVILDVLTDEEAREMLAHRLGAQRTAREPVAVNEIITRCARLPLALAVVAARAATQPRASLKDLADELGDARTRLDALADTDPIADVRAVFSWSYQALSEDSARLFRLLGLHPGPDISAPAAASLAALPVDRTRALLAQLTRAHLLTEHVSGRFTFHDLLRAYAAERAAGDETAADQSGALHRVLDHYVHTGLRGARLNPQLAPIEVAAAQPGVTPEEPADSEAAEAWTAENYPVLLAAIQRAADTGFDAHVGQLCWILWSLFDRRGLWRDWIAAEQTALAAAERTGDRAAQARAHRGLAYAHSRCGGPADVHGHHDKALALLVKVGDRIGQAHVHLNIGSYRLHEGHHREAMEHLERAYAIYRDAGLRVHEARAVRGLGSSRFAMGDQAAALADYERALAMHREMRDAYGEAQTLDDLGRVCRELGDHGRSLACLEHAVALFQGFGDRLSAALSNVELGDTHAAAGDTAAASAAWRGALAELDDLELAQPVADTVRAKLAATSSP
jgi:tetratricopeptide (TPR) repeat protein